MQQRIHVFLWLVVHDYILTNYSRWRRRLAESADCGVCNEMSDDTLHALRDCLETRIIWMHLIPSTLLHKFFTLNLNDWMGWNLTDAGLHKTDKN